MFDGSFDVSGICGSHLQLIGKLLEFTSAAACCLLGFTFMSAQELSGSTVVTVCWHLAGMNTDDSH
ncbi:MAG: hypothetical protein DWH81_15910 [Planctomycetota bacterium]|nr:MAG: hypothetical protein DWH81_15910 [Planctomycetota bacterium]